MDLRGFLIFTIYGASFMGVLVLVALWDRRKRRTRMPLGEDVRLLRMPGEHLWRRVIEKDESDMQWTLGLMIVPIFVGGFTLQIAAYFLGKTYVSLVIALLVFVFVMLSCIAWLVARLQRRQNEYLGFFGERFVADCLEPLKAKGWFIFHDIQCDGATGKFNLDHVAVGPGGIWVVETKTWRKGRARPGLKEHEVTFDGLKIVCPWGDETDALGQATNNANWLHDLLRQRLGKKIEVFAVLAFLGYFVTERKLGTVRLANPKNLPLVLAGRGNSVLNVEDLDLIRRQLEAQCRDVEY